MKNENMNFVTAMPKCFIINVKIKPSESFNYQYFAVQFIWVYL